MIETHIDDQDLDKLLEKLRKFPSLFRDARRYAMEMAAPEMKRELDRLIGGHGKVQNWQGEFIGSEGGYAAVRPLAKTYTKPTKKLGNRYAVGYVTNAINSGHAFPRPSGKDSYYDPRIRSGKMKVPGRKFYQQADKKTQDIAKRAAERILADLKAHLEG